MNKIRQTLSLLLAACILSAALPVGAELPAQVTVSVSVYDYTAADNENASETGVILEAAMTEVAPDATALEAICAALDAADIPYTLHAQYQYISAVNGLAEYACGAMSGWMFSVNDSFSNMGAASTTLTDGDTLQLHYSVNGYGADVGSYWSGGPTVTKFALDTYETTISSHTVYSGPDDYTGTTAYYLGTYAENGENTQLVGNGTQESPYEIPIAVEENYDMAAVTATIETTLHPHYRTFDSNFTDITNPCDYNGEVTFGLQTIGGFFTTYYKVHAIRQQPQGADTPSTDIATDLPDYDGDWTSFRGNAENMGITTAKTPLTAKLKWSKKYAQDGWTDAFTPPLIVNGSLYIAKNQQVLQIDPQNGAILATGTELANKIGFAINPITYGGGMFYVPLIDGRVQALRADTLESVWVSEPLSGQVLTSIAYHNGYVYTGTWDGETAEGTYFCLTVTDEDVTRADETKTATWKLSHMGGFYWAGAYVTDEYVIFGSDDSGSGATLYSVAATSGEVLDTVEGIAGDIRTAIAYDSETNKLYFSTTDGNFCRIAVRSDGTFYKENMQQLALGGMCTSTPLVFDGLAYLGVSGASPFAAEGHTLKVINVHTTPMTEIGSHTVPGYVQASALLSCGYYPNKEKVYVYLTYNQTPGGIYMVQAERTRNTVQLSGSDLFVPKGDMAQYCVCSLVCDSDGVLYYKNDSGYMMAIKSKPTTQKSTATSGGGTVSVTLPSAAKQETPTVKETEKTVMEEPEEAVAFADVPQSHWGWEYVQYLAQRDIIRGRTATDFAPEETVTRAEFLTILQRVSGEADGASAVLPEDVKPDDWFAGAVAWGLETGVINGVSKTSVAPTAPITRQDMATMLLRFATHRGIALQQSTDPITFADGAKIATYAKEAVYTMQMAGILNGREDGTFAPMDSATRAETAKILAVLMQKIQ